MPNDTNKLKEELKALRAETAELKAMCAEAEAGRAELAELRAQVNLNTETRGQLLTAGQELMSTLGKSQDGWERRFAAHLEALRHSPEMQARQEKGVLPTMACLRTEVAALREEVAVLHSIVMDIDSRRP